MYTPDDIRNIAFTVTRGRYEVNEVDLFVDQCADTVQMLMNDKAELEKKLEVLADKLVEYRNEEDSIRTALLSAQRLGDTVVREANHKAGLILDDANIKAQKVLETAKKNIKDEEAELVRIKKEVSNFKSRMLNIYREHLSLIDILPEVDEKKEEAPSAQPEKAEEAVQQPVAPVVQAAPEPAPVFRQPVEQPAFEPVEAEKTAEPMTNTGDVQKPFIINIPELDEEDEAVPVSAGNAVAAAAQDTRAGDSARTASRFADLKFGDEYDISKDDSEPKGFFKRKK